MKKYLILLVIFMWFLTGCTNSINNVNNNLTTFKREIVNVDDTALSVGTLYVSKNDDNYIFIVTVSVENDKVFDSILINKTITTTLKDYKVSLCFDEIHHNEFDDTYIYNEITLINYNVNYSLTFIVNENDIPVSSVNELEKVLNRTLAFTYLRISFYGIDDELFYVVNTYAELDN